MIIIEETGTSSVAFRFGKVSIYNDTKYIFQTINQNSREILLFTGEDISPDPLYFNQFEFVNGVTFSATQSRFDLDPGKYFLNVYQTENNDLNIGSASIIWDGEMKINGEDRPQFISYTQSNSNTITYYRG